MYVLFSNNTPKYIKDFTNFAVRELGVDSLRGQIDFEYINGSQEDDSYGCCFGDQREVSVHIATQSAGKSVSKEQKLKTIAHELVHAKQYLTRKLVSCEEEEYAGKWKGELVGISEYSHFLLPWEIEAEEAEQPMYDSWLENCYRYKKLKVRDV